MRARVLFLLMLGACSAPSHQASAALRACGAHPAAVDSIAGMITHLDALPHPVSVACAVASLERPLSVVASLSSTSAQPSPDAKDPRLFLMRPQLTLSVVPSGLSAQMIELGEWTTPTRTMKGELVLPIDAPLAADAPYAHVKYSANTTTCGLCHRAEQPATSTAGAYTSTAFRPAPETLVSFSAVEHEHTACIDSGEASDRCELFHALFDFGDVTAGAFDPQVELFAQ